MTNPCDEARRVAKALGWHPTAKPCECWTCQANRALTAAADEIEAMRLERHQLRNELTAARLEGERLDGEVERVTAQLNAVWSHCKVIFFPPMDDARGNYYLEHAPKAGKDMRAMIEHRLSEIANGRPSEPEAGPVASPSHSLIALYAGCLCEWCKNERAKSALKSNPAPSASSSGCFYPNCDCLCSEARESLGQLAKSSEVPRDRACDCSLGLCSKASRAPDQYCRINPP